MGPGRRTDRPGTDVGKRPGQDIVDPVMVHHVWLERPWRWRVESRRTDGRLHRLAIIRDDEWCAWERGHVARRGPDEPKLSKPEVGLDVAIMAMVDPEELLARLDLRDGLSTLGLEGDRSKRSSPPRLTIAVPVSRDQLVLWLGTDSFELQIDPDRGVVMRLIARFGADVLACYEFTDLVFDERLGSDLFDVSMSAVDPT